MENDLVELTSKELLELHKKIDGFIDFLEKEHKQNQIEE